MSDAMVSVLDVLEDDPLGRGVQDIRNEILDMDAAVKRHPIIW